MTRAVLSSLFGPIAYLANLGSYSVFIILLSFFTSTEVIDCEKYVQELPAVSNQPFEICAEKQSGNLIISDNTNIELYIPQESETIIIDRKTNQKAIQRIYKKAKKQAKQVKFSDFRKTDPVLSKFKDRDLEEPVVPTQTSQFTFKRLKQAIEEMVD